jgi:hypothetical protein
MMNSFLITEISRGVGAVKRITVLALAVGFSLVQATASITLYPATGVTPPGNGAGDDKVATWLGTIVAGYNAAHNPDLPTVGSQVFRLVNDNQPSLSPAYDRSYPTFGTSRSFIDIPTGDYNYVVLHWGKNEFQAFYVGDESGSTHHFAAPAQNGLSFYAMYSPVPEPTTMIAGAFALIPLVGSMARMARRKSRA